MMDRLAPGARVRIEYPSHNRLDLPLEYVTRNIEVTALVDYRGRPLSATGFVARPLVRRGSLLVHAIDLDLDQPRKFWAEAMRSINELPAYQLGLYDPEQPDELIDLLGRPFAPTIRDRIAMREAIQRFDDVVRIRGGSKLELAAFAVEA